MTKPPNFARPEFDEELDELLDHELEARIKASIWPHKKSMYAQHLLDERAVKRAKAEQAEQTEIARSAKNAAWVAIGISIVSALIATAGLVVAVIALLKRVGPS